MINNPTPSGEREAFEALCDELAAALREFVEADVSDARALARAVAFENNHRVTGTQAERIAALLLMMERNARRASAALAKLDGGK